MKDSRATSPDVRNQTNLVKLLHIVATPRAERSNTLSIATDFIANLRTQHRDLDIDVVDLFHSDLPAVAGTNIEVKYNLMVGGVIAKDHAESWSRIEHLIADFLAADVYVLTCPMWNFSIPYALKYYIDCLVQPGYVFQYNEQGYPEGMVHGKKLICITSRGGDYSPDTPINALDFQEPYLRAIFGFIGITDIEFVNVQPMDVTPEMRAAAMSTAADRLGALATTMSSDRVGGLQPTT